MDLRIIIVFVLLDLCWFKKKESFLDRINLIIDKNVMCIITKNNAKYKNAQKQNNQMHYDNENWEGNVLSYRENNAKMQNNNKNRFLKNI